jgi:hypothetical protein
MRYVALINTFDTVVDSMKLKGLNPWDYPDAVYDLVCNILGYLGVDISLVPQDEIEKMADYLLTQWKRKNEKCDNVIHVDFRNCN